MKIEKQKSHIDDGVANSENSVTVVYGKDNYVKGDNTDEKSDISKRYSKDFKFTLKSKEGKILLQEVVTFGTEEYPFPENWKEDHFAQISVLDYKQKFIDRNFDIDISEDTEFDI